MSNAVPDAVSTPLQCGRVQGISHFQSRWSVIRFLFVPDCGEALVAGMKVCVKFPKKRPSKIRPMWSHLRSLPVWGSFHLYIPAPATTKEFGS